MMKPSFFLNKWPSFIKVSFFFLLNLVLTLGCFFTVLYVVSPESIQHFFEMQEVQLAFIRTLAIFVFVGVAISLFVYWDMRVLIHRANFLAKGVLDERHLSGHFTEFFCSTSFEDVVVNMESLFKLFRSFDVMKANRISLDVNTIKQIIDNVSEGVLILNKDKIVTRLNAPCEEMFGLIPGELLGQVITRCITSELLISELDEVLSKGRKSTKIEMAVTSKRRVQFQVLPLKNKEGVLNRVVVILNYVDEA